MKYMPALPVETSKEADYPLFLFSSLLHQKEGSHKNSFVLDAYFCCPKLPQT